MRSASRLRILVALSLLAVWLSGCSGAPSPAVKPTVQRRAAVASPQAAASPVVLTGSSAVVASPQPELAAPSLRLPSDGLQVVMVDATEGQGIWIRRQPAGEPIRVWPDGIPMLVVGEDRYLDGRTWRNVQTLDGETGWAAAEYLFPTDPTTLARAAGSLHELPGGPRPGDAARSPEVQARVVTGESARLATPAPPPASAPPPSAPPPPATATPGTTARAASKPSTAPKPSAANVAAKPAPTATPVPVATPIRAPSGARAIAAGPSTMTLVGSERGVPIQIGNRPRVGMELLAVKIRVTNQGAAPLAHYRSSFRLALSDRTRVEPLAGGDAPIPYSATIEPGGALEGSLTLEVQIGTRVDDLIWAPVRDVTYALGI